MNFTLSPHIIDGRAYAATLKKQLKHDSTLFYQKHNVPPSLAIIRIGNNIASRIYVTAKKRACEHVLIQVTEHHLPDAVTNQDVIKLVKQINDDPAIHGLIIQLPLPPHLDKHLIVRAIDPLKDVDGLHPENLGLLFCGIPRFIPCTPKGCMKLILSTEKNITGLHAVVIGASTLVGRPMAQLLLQHGCTVTTLHSKTIKPEKLARQADILVAAAGVPALVKPSWVKPGAIVIDIGINRIPQQDKEDHLVGDVEFNAVQPITRAITPVPGGVGPMTVACLLDNTMLAANMSVGII